MLAALRRCVLAILQLHACIVAFVPVSRNVCELAVFWQRYSRYCPRYMRVVTCACMHATRDDDSYS
jgi:hypothetical protein